MRKFLKILSLIIFFTFLTCEVKAETGVVYLVKIDSAITPVIADFLIYSVNLANAKNANALIIELDTPGGLVESTRKIVKAMLKSRTPVIVYVYPSGARAGSAGTFILMASHFAVMAPGTHVGAAHPVTLVGKTSKTMMEKITNDLIAWVKNIAEFRHRNVRFAIKAVKYSKSITEKQALKLGVINLIAENLQELLKKADGKIVWAGSKKYKLHLKNVRIIEIKEDLKTRLLKVLTNPNLVYFLLMLGMAGLYFELSHPGAIFPGVVGAISLILALVGLSVLPVNYAGLLLIILAGVLYFLEVQIASHGLLAIGGTLALFLGSLMLFGKNPPELRIDPVFLYTVLFSFSAIFLGITYLAVKTVIKKPVSGKEALVGKIGKVMEDIDPEKGGKVFVEGEIWIAFAEKSIPKGKKVRVIKTEGLTLKVEEYY